MTENKINLVEEELEAEKRQRRRLLIFQTAAVMAIVVVFISSVFLFSYRRSLASGEIAKEQKILQDELREQGLREKQARLALLVDRAAIISKVMRQRNDYSYILNLLLQQSSTEISFKSLTVGEKTLSFTATSNSLLPLETFLNNLKSKVNQESGTFGKISIKSLSTDAEQGVHTLSVEVELL